MFLFRKKKTPAFAEKYKAQGLSPEAIEILTVRREILKKLEYTPQRLKRPIYQ